MTRVHVIHYSGATAKSSSVLASVALDYLETGADITVIDLAATTTIHQGLPPRWLVKLLGHRILDPNVKEVLEEAGVNYLTLQNAHDQQPIHWTHQREMEEALESELLTYFRLDRIPNSPYSRELQASLRKAMHDVYRSLEILWSNSPPDRVAIPNGRTSRQKAARLVATKLGIDVWLYENGRALPDSYYLGKTQPHDRVSSQVELREGFRLPPAEIMEEQALSWLSDRQAKDSKTNLFSEKWMELASFTKKDTDPVAVFFASSFDEFLAFGPMWRIDEWTHQFEAFDLIMSKMETEGFALVLRLHPNLASKSRAYFRREILAVKALMAKYPRLKIHWHNEPTNSYDLVRSADLVIVERSTIGLEASLMGKPVIACQATQWDQSVDVRQVLRRSDVTREVLIPWRPSARGAQQFVAYWLAQEHPLRFAYRHWSTWDPEKPPLAMKLAQLALQNSFAHKFRLLAQEITKWQNNRFRPVAKVWRK